MFIIRFVFYFTLSFALMCIPIGDGRHLFDKLFEMATPYADKALKTTKQKISSTKRYSKKLYSNSEPVEKDEVQNKTSATLKDKIKKDVKESFDAYTEEEKARLRKVLDDSHE
jgi:gas vesicle protein